MLTDEQVQLFMQRIRGALKIQRKALKLTQRALQQRSGVDQPVISRIEDVQTYRTLVPELSTLARLCDGLGLSLAKFFLEVDNQGGKDSVTESLLDGKTSDRTTLSTVHRPGGERGASPYSARGADDLKRAIESDLYLDLSKFFLRRSGERSRESDTADRAGEPKRRSRSR